MDLPIKKAVFDESDPRNGLKFISLVSQPATEIEWVKFSKEQEIQLAIQSDEKMRFLAPVLIPDQLVLRKDKQGNPYYLTFDADTIERIAYNWQKKKLSSNVDIEHTRKLVEGVTFVETFISNKATIGQVKNYESLPERTWFVVGEADSPEAWKPIKDGVVKGVSIDGLFDIEGIEMSISEEDLKAVIAQIL